MKSAFFYDSPIGIIGITQENGAISQVFFGDENPPPGFAIAETPLIEETARQLNEFFAGSRQDFDLPLKLSGTDFQKSVWKALQTIPYGETRSYQEIALLVGSPKACRAVGLANNRNPISIIIPCHRVIGKDGSLTGYGGGLEAKEFLLELEKEHKSTA